MRCCWFGCSGGGCECGTVVVVDVIMIMLIAVMVLIVIVAYGRRKADSTGIVISVNAWGDYKYW